MKDKLFIYASIYLTRYADVC